MNVNSINENIIQKPLSSNHPKEIKNSNIVLIYLILKIVKFFQILTILKKIKNNWIEIKKKLKKKK